MRKRRINRLRLATWVVAIAAGALLIAARLALYAPPEDTRQLTDAEAMQAAEAVADVEETVRQVNAAAGEGLRKPFGLSLDQDDLTNHLRSDKHMGDALKARDVTSPRVEFRDQSIVTSCVANVQGRKIHITINGRLSPSSNGGMVFHSDSVLLGRLPAPPVVKRKVERAVNDYLLLGAIALPAAITDINIDDGTLTIEGVSNPDLLSGR